MNLSILVKVWDTCATFVTLNHFSVIVYVVYAVYVVQWLLIVSDYNFSKFRAMRHEKGHQP